MKQKFLPILFCIWALVIFLSSGCARNVSPVSQTDFFFDTVITITLYDTENIGSKGCDEILSSCFSLCETYEKMLSRTVKGSDIWNINHAAGTPVTVHPETARLLKKSLYFCAQTDGLVDITIAPVSDLWNFSSNNLLEMQPHDIPSHTRLQSLLSHVDYHAVHVDGNLVTLADPEASIDLGCIAKGYIADQLKAHLISQGITSALINLGGNIQTIGSKPDGSAYMLGIQKPFDTAGTLIATLPVTDASLVSSGIYERYFKAEDILYHHLLNSKTGMPVENELLGVTILADSSADADVLSTAAFLLGLDEGMEYIESFPDTEAVFITKDYELHPSSGLSHILQKQ